MPEVIKAFIIAHAPGIGTTLIDSSIHFFIISSPGSQIPEFPHQKLVQYFFLAFNSFINSSVLISSLCLMITN